MSIVIDVVLWVLEGAVAPSSERGLVGAFAAGSLASLSVALWVVMMSAESLRQPGWAVAAFAASIVVGGCGVFVALLHWSRNRSDSWFSGASAAISGAAVAFPILWLAAR